MTIERKIIVGLQDIKAVSYECNKCGAKTTFPLGYAREPLATCYICSHTWRVENARSPYAGEHSPYHDLLEAASKITALEKEAGFRIVFEFDELSASREAV